MFVAFGLLQAAPTPPSAITQFAPLGLMLVAAYFLLFRPMQKQRKEQEALRSSLKPGDEVLTSGGLFGVVAKLRDDRIVLRVSEGVNVEVARSAISSVIAQRERE